MAPLADRDDRIIEVHPELSFSVLAGGPIPASKKSWDGLMRRKLLLEQAGIYIPEVLGEAAGRVGPDDVLDAAVAAWTADRKRRGLANHIGGGAGSGRGSPTIWF